MAKLKVFLDGQMVSEHGLSVDHEFIAGRGETCDCVLRPERGISRQHFKIILTELGWQLESLSRYGELYVGTEKIEKHHLKHGQMFSAPPYEFVFEETSERAPSEIPLPSVTHSQIRATSQGDDEKTSVGVSSSAAMMRLIDYGGQTRQVFSLQGLSWIGGRDISCTLFIDNPKISRRQFEIQKVEETFFIRDLNSVNGTIVNGAPIPADQWTQLSSSDVISIADWSLIFEIRDVSFDQRVRELDPAFNAPVAFTEGTAGHQLSGPVQDPGSMPALYLPPRPYVRGFKNGGKDLFGIKGLNPIRLAIACLILTGGGYYLMDGNSSEPIRTSRVQTPFDKLPAEKQQLVKQLSQLAHDLYNAGKYESAGQKIDEIHGLVPYYEDSKELQKYIDNAVQIQRDRESLAAKQEDERRRKEKVEKILTVCRVLVEKKRATIGPEELENCLAPAVEFDPDNAAFTMMRAQVQTLVDDRKANAVKSEEFKKMVAKRQKMYQIARANEDRGHIYTAIEEYHKVVVSPLPDPNDLIVKAKRRIASLQKSLGSRQGALKLQAEEEYKKGNRNVAIELLRKARKVKQNDEIDDRISEITKELSKDLQGKYQESILEESVGSVAEAKKKWFEIMKVSIEGETYFDKAKIKLKKYGDIHD